eukprot:710873-Pelagomonas_calceolata.AAC.2
MAHCGWDPNLQTCSICKRCLRQAGGGAIVKLHCSFMWCCLPMPPPSVDQQYKLQSVQSDVLSAYRGKVLLAYSAFSVCKRCLRQAGGGAIAKLHCSFMWCCSPMPPPSVDQQYKLRSGQSDVLPAYRGWTNRTLFSTPQCELYIQPASMNSKPDMEPAQTTADQTAVHLLFKRPDMANHEWFPIQASSSLIAHTHIFFASVHTHLVKLMLPFGHVSLLTANCLFDWGQHLASSLKTHMGCASSMLNPWIPRLTWGVSAVCLAQG